MTVPIQIQGQGGQVIQIDGSHRAERVSVRPLDHGTLGHYMLHGVSGAVAATLAANSPLFSFRWTDATRLAVITRIELSAVVSAAITAAVPFGLQAIMARSFTVSDSGGTALTPSGNSQKQRTSMGASLAGDIRVATTATLTAGTRTLDAFPFAGILFGTGTAVGSSMLPWTIIFDQQGTVDYPLILATNEGFIIRNPLAGPATGTFQIAVTVRWAEVASFDNAQLG